MFGFSYDVPAKSPEPEFEILETELEKVLKNINLVKKINIEYFFQIEKNLRMTISI